MLIHSQAEENDERIILIGEGQEDNLHIIDADQLQSQENVASMRKFFNLFDTSSLEFSFKDDLPNSGLLDWNNNMVTAASGSNLTVMAEFLFSKGMAQMITQSGQTPLSNAIAKGDVEMMTIIQ